MKPRKGVSEILATMIVLMIVSSLGVMLYNISLSNLSSQQSNLSSSIEIQKSMAQERFEIIDVKRRDDSNVIVYFINYGSMNVNINSVYLECKGRGSNLESFIIPMPTPTQNIVLDKISSITLPVIRDITDTYYVTFRIVSQRGVLSELQIDP
jgi:hypothetical protein